jgi:hypothetical protein
MGLKKFRANWDKEAARQGKDDRKISHVCKSCGCGRYNPCGCMKKNESKERSG